MKRKTSNRVQRKVADEELTPITDVPRNWWLAYTMFNGKPGRSGPYTRVEAEHRMRATNWRPGASPVFQQDEKGGRGRGWVVQNNARKRLAQSRAASSAKAGSNRKPGIYTKD